MSRSNRKPIKRIGARGEEKAALRRQSRRSIKNSLRSQEPNEELQLPLSREIVNGYTFLDKKETKDDI